jgi:hypothetical protein
VSELAPAMFWMFVAVIIVAAIWRKTTLQREQLATIRMAIEKGQPLDPAMMDRVLRQPPEKESMIGGALVTMASGVGLGIMGFFIAIGGDREALYPLIGVGCMVALIGVALLVGDWIERRRIRHTREPRS